MEKRFQYWSEGGIKWTKWFPYNSSYMPKWQLDKKLLNEYR